MILSQDYSRVVASRSVHANWGSDGDFITPDGEIVHAGENHTIFMMENSEKFGGSRDPEDLIGQGWIRTRTMFGTFSVDAGGGMNENQLHVLQKMVRDRCRYSDPRIEVLMNDGDVYELTCDEFDEIEYPNQIKRGFRSAVRN